MTLFPGARRCGHARFYGILWMLALSALIVLSRPREPTAAIGVIAATGMLVWLLVLTDELRMH